MAKKNETKTKLVKMTRKLAAGQTGPTTAEVHPDEVDNYAANGWQKPKAS